MQEACRKHAGSPHHLIKAEWGTHTKKATFLGSTQEAHMGATCVLPSVATLTGRSVCFSVIFEWPLYLVFPYLSIPAHLIGLLSPYEMLPFPSFSSFTSHPSIPHEKLTHGSIT